MASLATIEQLEDKAVSEFILNSYNSKNFYHTLSGCFIMINPIHMVMKNLSDFEEDPELLHNFSTKSKGVDLPSVHLYRFAEDIRRATAEESFSQTVVFRGFAGSGKSESMKRVLQYLICCTTSKKDATLNPDPSQPLGFSNNPFNLPSEVSKCGKILSLAMTLYDAMGNGGSSFNNFSSRHIKHVNLIYGRDGRIVGAKLEALMTNLISVSNKDPARGPALMLQLFLSGIGKKADDYHINSTHKEGFLGNTEFNPDQHQDFHHIHNSLIGLDILSEAEWDDFLKVLAIVVNLQSVSLMGSETTIISSNTKSFVSNAEKLLGIAPGELSAVILKRPDDRIGKAAGSTVDNKPSEAKAFVDLFSQTIFIRAFDFLLLRCSEHSFTDPEISQQFRTGLHTIGKGESPLFSELHLVDPPGWIKVESGAYANLMEFIVGYYEEKLNGFFISKVFEDEIERYALEDIELGTISFPDCLPIIQLFEKPQTGLFGICEEMCQSLRGDDQGFLDKILETHTKGKLIKSGGIRAKKTAFTVKHSFFEIIYDSEGFLLQNKTGQLSSQGQQILANSGIPFLQKEVLPLFHQETSEKMEETPSVSTGSRMSKGRNDKAQTIAGFKLTKARLGINSLMTELETIKNPHFMLCLSICRNSRRTPLPSPPVAPSGPRGRGGATSPVPPAAASAAMSTGYSKEHVLSQIRYYCLDNLIKLSQCGFPYVKPFSEFYQRYRSILPLETPNLPMKLDETVMLGSQKAARESCRGLLQIVQPLAEGFQKSVNKFSEFLPGENPVYGKTSIFLKEKFANFLEEYRDNYLEVSKSASTKIQSNFRKHWKNKRYLKFRKGIIYLQSYIRLKITRKKYLKQKKSSTKIKSIYKMQKSYKVFKELQAAVNVLKFHLLGKMIQRIRYKRLIRAAKTFQGIAKGFTIRKSAISAFTAVELIQKTAINFLKRRRLEHLRYNSSVAIQRVYRGYSKRCKNMGITKVLTIRREQRIAHKVVQKLQSLFRTKLIKRRIKEVSRAVVKLQWWFRGRMQYRRLRKVLYLAEWLQSIARRIIAINYTNTLRVKNMVADEKGVLSGVYKEEIRSIDHVPSHQRIFGSGRLRNGSVLYESFLVLYDVNFDLAFAFPEGLLAPIVDFCQKLKSQEKKYITQMVVGTQHVVLLDDVSGVYTFGLGDLGQLGHNNRKSLALPKKIEKMDKYLSSGVGRVGSKVEIKEVSCGRDHTVILTKCGRVFSWGDNHRGQLGHSHFESSATPRLVGAGESSRDLRLKPLKHVKMISCGDFHSACIAEPGVLYTWGNGFCIGRAGADRRQYKQGIKIGDRSGWLAVGSAGEDRSLEGGANLGPDSRPLIPGTNAEIQDSSDPDVLPFFSKKKVQWVVCGDGHTTAKCGGQIFAWGFNGHGQLGDGSKDMRRQPVRILVPTLSETDVARAEIHSGGRHMALVCNGNIWLWGSNRYGQIGNGTFEDVTKPLKVTLPHSESSNPPQPHKLTTAKLKSETRGAAAKPKNRSQYVVSATLGWRHSLVLTATQDIFAWGIVHCVSPEFVLPKPVPPMAVNGSNPAVGVAGSSSTQTTKRSRAPSLAGEGFKVSENEETIGLEKPEKGGSEKGDLGTESDGTEEIHHPRRKSIKSSPPPPPLNTPPPSRNPHSPLSLSSKHNSRHSSRRNSENKDSEDKASEDKKLETDIPSTSLSIEAKESDAPTTPGPPLNADTGNTNTLKAVPPPTPGEIAAAAAHAASGGVMFLFPTLLQLPKGCFSGGAFLALRGSSNSSVSFVLIDCETVDDLPALGTLKAFGTGEDVFSSSAPVEGLKNSLKRGLSNTGAGVKKGGSYKAPHLSRVESNTSVFFSTVQLGESAFSSPGKHSRRRPPGEYEGSPEEKSYSGKPPDSLDNRSVGTGKRSLFSGNKSVADSVQSTSSTQSAPVAPWKPDRPYSTLFTGAPLGGRGVKPATDEITARFREQLRKEVKPLRRKKVETWGSGKPTGVQPATEAIEVSSGKKSTRRSRSRSRSNSPSSDSFSTYSGERRRLGTLGDQSAAIREASLDAATTGPDGMGKGREREKPLEEDALTRLFSPLQLSSIRAQREKKRLDAAAALNPKQPSRKTWAAGHSGVGMPTSEKAFLTSYAEKLKMKKGKLYNKPTVSLLDVVSGLGTAEDGNDSQALLQAVTTNSKAKYGWFGVEKKPIEDKKTKMMEKSPLDGPSSSLMAPTLSYSARLHPRRATVESSAPPPPAQASPKAGKKLLSSNPNSGTATPVSTTTSSFSAPGRRASVVGINPQQLSAEAQLRQSGELPGSTAKDFHTQEDELSVSSTEKRSRSTGTLDRRTALGKIDNEPPSKPPSKSPSGTVGPAEYLGLDRAIEKLQMDLSARMSARKSSPSPTQPPGKHHGQQGKPLESVDETKGSTTAALFGATEVSPPMKKLFSLRPPQKSPSTRSSVYGGAPSKRASTLSPPPQSKNSVTPAELKQQEAEINRQRDSLERARAVEREKASREKQVSIEEPVENEKKSGEVEAVPAPPPPKFKISSLFPVSEPLEEEEEEEKEVIDEKARSGSRGKSRPITLPSAISDAEVPTLRRTPSPTSNRKKSAPLTLPSQRASTASLLFSDAVEEDNEVVEITSTLGAKEEEEQEQEEKVEHGFTPVADETDAKPIRSPPLGPPPAVDEMDLVETEVNQVRPEIQSSDQTSVEVPMPSAVNTLDVDVEDFATPVEDAVTVPTPHALASSTSPPMTTAHSSEPAAATEISLVAPPPTTPPVLPTPPAATHKTITPPPTVPPPNVAAPPLPKPGSISTLTPPLPPPTPPTPSQKVAPPPSGAPPPPVAPTPPAPAHKTAPPPIAPPVVSAPPPPSETVIPTPPAPENKTLPLSVAPPSVLPPSAKDSTVIPPPPVPTPPAAPPKKLRKWPPTTTPEESPATVPPPVVPPPVVAPPPVAQVSKGPPPNPPVPSPKVSKWPPVGSDAAKAKPPPAKKWPPGPATPSPPSAPAPVAAPPPAKEPEKEKHEEELSGSKSVFAKWQQKAGNTASPGPPRPVPMKPPPGPPATPPAAPDKGPEPEISSTKSVFAKWQQKAAGTEAPGAKKVDPSKSVARKWPPPK